MISRRNLLAGAAAVAVAAALPAVTAFKRSDDETMVYYMPHDDIWVRYFATPGKVIDLLGSGNLEIEFEPLYGTYQGFKVWHEGRWILDTFHDRPLSFLPGERGTLCLSAPRPLFKTDALEYNLVAICRTMSYGV